MAIKCICDGCGKETADYRQDGFVATCDYCTECQEVYEDFAKDLNALHDKIAEKWRKERSALRKRYMQQLTKLPDMPPDE